MRTEHTGRYFVLLSLAEAETIRCIMHLREGKPLIPGSDVAIALRCVAAHDAVFDRVAPVSTRAKTTPAYQAHVSHDCFRFIDGNMHFKPAELNVILRSIPELPMRRCLFFKLTIACRRRLFKGLARHGARQAIHPRGRVVDAQAARAGGTAARGD